MPVRGAAELVHDLAALPVSLDRESRRALREAVEPIASDARARASWSGRIPGAIRVRTRQNSRGIAVSIRVSGKTAPHARPIEHEGKPGNFRHPVYADAKEPRGRWTWVNQQARPFLAPAARAGYDQVAEKVADAITAVARRHGWR
ncbi:MAG TPA: hypothetical protein VGJ95_08705 [Pseudonocardiaceae bacterium]|jgi:hypothetical protein